MEKGTKNVIRIVVCVVLLGAIAVIIPTFLRINSVGRTDEVKVIKVKADFAGFRNACGLFRIDYGRWPASLEELHNPGPPPGGGKTYQYLLKAPLDPWTGKPYTVRFLPDDSPEFVSLGADRAPGGQGVNEDIVANTVDEE